MIKIKIVIDIGHPGHVHFFKNFIWQMEKRGHSCYITALDKEASYFLLKQYGFDYFSTGKVTGSVVKKLLNIPIADYRVYRSVKKFNPDIYMGLSSYRAAQVAYLTGKKSIIFDDTEHAKWTIRLYKPFASQILTPSCFMGNLGLKQVRYDGYHELAYLHPNWFKPDPSVLDELGVSKEDRYVIVRFVAWDAGHDIGQHGLSLEGKKKVIKGIEKEGIIPLITSEGPLPKDFEKYRIRIQPHRMHDALYYATMYIGEGATMASEAAVLGTPAIYISSLAGTMGNFIELENKYHLVYSYRYPRDALTKIGSMLRKTDIKNEWKTRKEEMLKDKIDVTSFLTWFIENYPESARIMKENPRYQDKFRSMG